MKIDNLIQVNNTNGLTVKGVKANQNTADPGDFLAALLMAAAQEEQANPQQQSNNADNAALLQLFAGNFDINTQATNDSAINSMTLADAKPNPLATDQLKQLIKTLQALARNNNSQNSAVLNEQQLKILAEALNGGVQASGKGNLDWQQIVQQLQTHLQTDLTPKELQHIIQQLQVGEVGNVAELQKLLQQLSKQSNNQLHTNIQSKDKPPITDTMGQINQATMNVKTAEPTPSVLTSLANLAQQGQPQRGTPNGYQQIGQQLAVQNVENTAATAVTVQHNGQNAEIKSAGSTSLEQLGSRFVELVKEMAVRQQPNYTTVRLKLKPASLGEVLVRLTYQRGELNAQFYATTSHGKEALEAALPQLRDTLMQQQVKLNETTVFLSNGENQWSGRQSSQTDHKRGISGRYKTSSVEHDDMAISGVAVDNNHNSIPSRGLNLLV